MFFVTYLVPEPLPSTAGVWASVICLLYTLSDATPSCQTIAQGTSDLHEKPRIAICIVGQVERTELRSKIKHLIEPNLGSTNMHTFLILQPGAASFTNRPSIKCDVAPRTVKDASAQLSAIINTTAIEQPRENFDVNPSRWGYPDRGNRLISRLQNHINQFISWRTCATAVAQKELEDGKFFDAILRLRDNALVLRPFSFLRSLQKLKNMTQQNALGISTNSLGYQQVPVMLKACASWGGYNDKVGGAPACAKIR